MARRKESTKEMVFGPGILTQDRVREVLLQIKRERIDREQQRNRSGGESTIVDDSLKDN